MVISDASISFSDSDSPATKSPSRSGWMEGEKEGWKEGRKEGMKEGGRKSEKGVGGRKQVRAKEEERGLEQKGKKGVQNKTWKPYSVHDANRVMTNSIFNLWIVCCLDTSQLSKQLSLLVAEIALKHLEWISILGGCGVDEIVPCFSGVSLPSRSTGHV